MRFIRPENYDTGLTPGYYPIYINGEGRANIFVRISPFSKCQCVVWFVWTQYPNYCENNGVCLQATILFCKENFPFLPYSCIKTLNKPAEFFLWCCFLKWITIFQLLPFTFLKSYFLFHYCCSLMRCKFFEKNRCIFLCF